MLIRSKLVSIDDPVDACLYGLLGVNDQSIHGLLQISKLACHQAGLHVVPVALLHAIANHFRAAFEVDKPHMLRVKIQNIAVTLLER